MNLSDYFKKLTSEKKKTFLSGLEGSLKKGESTIRSYINGNRNIPPKHAHEISEATKGLVTIETLCPDVFKGTEAPKE